MTNEPAAADIVFGYPDVPTSLDRAVLLMDKPGGWSSFDVIRSLRRILQVRKIGHAGTLDPMATGLLICLAGRATKLMTAFMTLPKVYEGVLRLGEVTSSHDAETEVVERHEWRHLTMEDLERARTGFVGDVEQLPPMYSAVKVEGERLYRKARRGEEVVRPSRAVHIASFDLMGRDGPDVSFRVHCSKGTYIRSLAYDFGKSLGVGAHLVALRRTAIGSYTVDRAWRPEQLDDAMSGRQ
jgi:tRNA pseudouridine55 synthase